MKKYQLVLAALLVAVFVLGACAPAAPAPAAAPADSGAPAAAPADTQASAPAAKEDLYLGVTAPMTGNYAEYGRRWKQGMDMALEEINAADTVPGRTVKLQWEDSQSDPKQSATIAKKFVDDPKIVAVIGDFSSSASLAGAPIYLEAKKVQLSPTASDAKFAATGEYMFGIVGSMNGEAPYLANFAVTELNKKNIAVMFINNDWGNTAKDIFVDSAKKLGANILDEQGYLDGSKDFIATLTRIQAEKPDLLFIAAFYADGAAIQKQRADMGWDVPVLSPASAYSPQLLAQGGSAVDGQYVTTTFFTEDPSPKVQDFIKRFKAKYNEDPDQFNAMAYDAVWLMSATIGKTGTDSDKIRQGLVDYVSGYVGVTGPGKFGPDRISVKSYVPLQVQDGQFKLWKKP